MTDSISISAIPWCHTLQHLELSRVTCTKARGSARGLSFLAQLTALTSLSLNDVSPALVSADLAGCALLEKLSLTRSNCSDAVKLLTTASKNLDLSACISLRELACSSCNILALNVSKCMKLRKLDCSNNRIRVLECSNHPDLIELRCRENMLLSLDVTASRHLEVLVVDCNDNMSSLGMPDGNRLRSLACRDTSITSLHVSHHTDLQRLACGSYHMTDLDFSGCTALQLLECTGVEFGALDLRAFTSLRFFTLEGHSRMGTLNLAGLSQLKNLLCVKSRISKLDVSGCAALSWHHLNSNGKKFSYLHLNKCCSVSSTKHVGHATARPGYDTEKLGMSCKSCKIESVDVSDDDIGGGLCHMRRVALDKLGIPREY